MTQREPTKAGGNVAKKPICHVLKTDHAPFRLSFNGLKAYELRKNDRDFMVGDLLLLLETRQTGKTMEALDLAAEYTGRALYGVVASIYPDDYSLIACNYVLMQLSGLSPQIPTEKMDIINEGLLHNYSGDKKGQDPLPGPFELPGPVIPDPFEYIKKTYGVPAEFGREVIYKGPLKDKTGVICSDEGNKIGVVFDSDSGYGEGGENITPRLYFLHPTYHLKYTDQVRENYPRKWKYEGPGPDITSKFKKDS